MDGALVVPRRAPPVKPALIVEPSGLNMGT